MFPRDVGAELQRVTMLQNGPCPDSDDGDTGQQSQQRKDAAGARDQQNASKTG